MNFPILLDLIIDIQFIKTCTKYPNGFFILIILTFCLLFQIWHKPSDRNRDQTKSSQSEKQYQEHGVWLLWHYCLNYKSIIIIFHKNNIDINHVKNAKSSKWERFWETNTSNDNWSVGTRKQSMSLELNTAWILSIYWWRNG